MTLRVPNIMKHVCVAARTADTAKGGAADIRYISKPPDKGSGRSGSNPKGWHEFSPKGCVAPLDRILDMLVVALLALSENRDSASRVSLC